jgi:S1-C subfamily serine protease
MNKIYTLAVLAMLAGCNSTTTMNPIALGQGKYIVTSRGNLFPTGMEPVLEDAIGKGAELCSREGKSIEVISAEENPGPYVMGNYPKATVTFICANADGTAEAKKVQRQGSGFFVSKAGHIITNEHVIDGCTAFEIVADNSNKPVTFLSKDANNDIALLKAETSQSVAFFREGRGIRQGDDVAAFGYPLSGLLSDSAKVTNGIVSSLSGMANDMRYVQITAPVQPGNSGGPLLDKSGNVVGLVTSKLDAMKVQKITGDIPQNINFAIKASILRSFLETNEVGYEIRTSDHQKEISAIANEAKDFTVKIQCSN